MCHHCGCPKGSRGHLQIGPRGQAGRDRHAAGGYVSLDRTLDERREPKGAGYNQTIVEARENNAGLVSVRYFMTLFDKRTIISQDIARLLEEKLGASLFSTTIRRNIAIEESQYAQRTIFDYAPKSTGAEDYSALAKEVTAWLESD